MSRSLESAGSASLDGLLIADFGRVLAGPYATMLLADLGADVVKIERAGVGDDTRQWGPPWVGDESTYFQSVNRNKRSFAWDLREPADLQQARELTARADVVVENFLPGTMDRLGLGYDAVREINPDVVYCSVTGFGGQNDLPGYDLLIQAVGGLMSITGPEPGVPTKVGVAVVDIITGLHAAVGILAALRHRDRTGEGQRVEVNLLSSLLSALANQTSGYVGAGVVPQAMGNRHPSIAPYEVFRTGDRPLVLAVGNNRQFASLVEVLGVPELADDERYATNTQRVAHREQLVRDITAALSAGSADEWFEKLTAQGVPCGPLNDIADAVALAERLGLNPVVEIDDPRRDRPVRQVANPIRLSATPASYRSAPPRLGEDTPAVSTC
ncbi:CaiB/BaiF CoA transferase family protein [Rhodococcus opacus]|uniref:CaiB/BaiF CoA transferase family protein n=1 Tax=Rhodococcus opacus TaxID=37919 RepID=UPI0002A2B9A9|nr:CoA transferase [Rhodococcus opacus]ELB89528.1 transferase [Rhodococcus wratislaviensis IFP 2016]MDJ0413417.1 CoA transferase [Rhodococcus opacus]MDX5966951.1 CoA transferase [Rhodococcus opacus]NKY71171.1 CoA transferase [Rhodococcus opacus]CAG7584477.1 Acetyl-CoA:oxalate CoA-transferase [Rhodococcus opacus]